MLACASDTPSLAPMSRQERVTICRSDAEVVDRVLEQLSMAAELLAPLSDGLDAASFERPLLYNFPEPTRRTVRWEGRSAVHEGRQHLLDVTRLLAHPSGAVSGPPAV